MATTYDKSVGPKEGKSAISGKTRKRIFGGDRGIGSFKDWQNTQGPVKTDESGIDINTQQVPGLQTPVQPQWDITNQLFNPQQMLGNMFNPQQQGAQEETPADQQKKLQMWIDWMREKQAADLQRPGIAFNAAAQASDPVRYAQEQYTARLASDPWGPGGQFEKSPRLSPAAALASQGNNATNQWAQLGGVPGIDPEELKRLNAAAAAGRGYRSYF